MERRATRPSTEEDQFKAVGKFAISAMERRATRPSTEEDQFKAICKFVKEARGTHWTQIWERHADELKKLGLNKNKMIRLWRKKIPEKQKDEAWPEWKSNARGKMATPAERQKQFNAICKFVKEARGTLWTQIWKRHADELKKLGLNKNKMEDLWHNQIPEKQKDEAWPEWKSNANG